MYCAVVQYLYPLYTRDFVQPTRLCLMGFHELSSEHFVQCTWTVEHVVQYRGWICSLLNLQTHTFMRTHLCLSSLLDQSSPCILCAYQICDRVSLEGGQEGEWGVQTNVSCIQRSYICKVYSIVLTHLSNIIKNYNRLGSYGHNLTNVMYGHN